MKLIINILDDIEPSRALRYVSRIIEKGRISEGPRGAQFCGLTRIETAADIIHVCADKNEKSDRFTLYKADS